METSQLPARPCLVVSQPMYFPWVGMLEQIRRSDIFVHYDDVQFSRGGFCNRVQIKTQQGIRWLTVPLPGQKHGQNINEILLGKDAKWQSSHIDQLKQAYVAAPFKKDMLAVVDSVFALPNKTLADLTRASVEALIRYFPGLGDNKRILRSSTLGIPGSSTQRLINLCDALEIGTYVTGHGARNYLDHEAFETRGVTVSYMDYGLKSYPQLHGAFTPYVSALDLIANRGPAGIAEIGTQTSPWREFLARVTPMPQET